MNDEDQNGTMRIEVLIVVYHIYIFGPQGQIKFSAVLGNGTVISLNCFFDTLVSTLDIF